MNTTATPIDRYQERLHALEMENAKLKLQLQQQESDLGYSNRFFRHILDNIPSDLVAFDSQHRYIYINPVAVKDQETREWLIGKTDFDYCKRRGYSMTLAEGRRKVFEQIHRERKCGI